MNQINRRVVVTGLGAISPVGNDVKTSWDNLVSGVHGIGPITRFDTTEYKAKLAAEVRNFDARQYMEKAETLRSDLYAQYALASACQAVEESGILGTVDPERFAVYFGSGIGGINTFTREHKKLLDRGPSRVSPYFIPMMIANMGAGMIAIRFNCQGAALPAVTACASGSNAIGEAVRAIRHGYADAVISGGAEASINECGVAGFINMQALSVSDNIDAASLPFDRRRAGFIIGEGAAALVLEEYEHAVKRGAKIYGEISGYGSTCDAYHITAPLPDAAGGARAMKQALEESGYTGEEKLYINAHGTGTPLNDSGETIAIKTALGEEKARASYVSSTKSMTGHMLGAAGAMEAVVCLKVLETGIIPPTLNLLEPDPACDLNYVPNQAVKADIDLCLSNSLGFGGHNACLAFRKV
ncbi:MAG TPA: beta-ketoacyl-ACP synthase II [Candidatus Merdisoma faecalis]|nr:beta-ketoacyl-ACP synthase II [Lachnoclostridium sp. An138]OUQ19179.1 beta-ketoacyl-[acyl-carrier-protein] synthase II [Lachnoclostridium sp. An138]HIR98668.1 beta-ketoacyl-ACP synthase II [Candidatus Merdisoma faecalis]